jgi:hypothetical protein
MIDCSAGWLAWLQPCSIFPRRDVFVTHNGARRDRLSLDSVARIHQSSRGRAGVVRVLRLRRSSLPGCGREIGLRFRFSTPERNRLKAVSGGGGHRARRTALTTVSSEEEPHIVGTREGGYFCVCNYCVLHTDWFVLRAVSTGLRVVEPCANEGAWPARGGSMDCLICAVTVGWRDGLPAARIGVVGREDGSPAHSSSTPTQSIPTQHAGNIGAQPKDGMACAGGGCLRLLCVLTDHPIWTSKYTVDVQTDFGRACAWAAAATAAHTHASHTYSIISLVLNLACSPASHLRFVGRGI